MRPNVQSTRCAIGQRPTEPSKVVNEVPSNPSRPRVYTRDDRAVGWPGLARIPHSWAKARSLPTSAVAGRPRPAKRSSKCSMRSASDLTAFEWGALLGCPGGKLVSAWPRREVCVGFVLGELRNQCLRHALAGAAVAQKNVAAARGLASSCTALRLKYEV